MTNSFLLYQTFCELFPDTPMTEEECEKFHKLYEAMHKLEGDLQQQLHEDILNDMGDHYGS